MPFYNPFQNTIKCLVDSTGCSQSSSSGFFLFFFLLIESFRNGENFVARILCPAIVMMQRILPILMYFNTSIMLLDFWVISSEGVELNAYVPEDLFWYLEVYIYFFHFFLFLKNAVIFKIVRINGIGFTQLGQLWLECLVIDSGAFNVSNLFVETINRQPCLVETDLPVCNVLQA